MNYSPVYRALVRASPSLAMRFFSRLRPAAAVMATAINAPLTTRGRNNLAHNKFAYVDSDGVGHLPVDTKGRAANARARFNQTYFESETKAREAWHKILAAEKRFGIKGSGDDTMPTPKIRKPAGASARISGTSAFAVAIESENAPEWIELIPAGEFKAVDGRGPFVNADPQAVVNASLAKMPPAGMVLDYDHSTEFAAPKGRPAIAAGWIKTLQVRNGAIFARIEWTEAGAKAVEAKEYRYVSPVFDFDRPAGVSDDAMTGTVTRVLHAALTNNPALINLPAIAAANATRGQSMKVKLLTPEQKNLAAAVMAAEGDGASLSKIVAALEKALPDADENMLLEIAQKYCALKAGDGDNDADDGDDDAAMDAADGDPYGDESTEQMAARHAEEMARCASEDERAAMGRKHREEMARRGNSAVASARSIQVDEKQIARLVDQRVARHPMMLSAQRTITEMRGTQAKKDAEATVDASIKAGKLIPAQREWAIAYCTGDRAGFDKFIGAQPTFLPAGADGTFTARPAGAAEDANALTASERTICAQLRVKPETFLARRKEVHAAMNGSANGATIRFEVE